MNSDPQLIKMNSSSISASNSGISQVATSSCIELADLDLAKGYFSSLCSLHDLVTQGRYIRKSWYDAWVKAAVPEEPQSTWELFFTWLFRRNRWQSIRILRRCIRRQNEVRESLNQIVMASNLEKHQAFFDAVEANPLTIAQRVACVSDEDANLVIAGAGTGKTSTIVSKVGVLIRTQEYRPEDILAISYTKKSAIELSERIKDRLSADVRVATFHKLGLSILANASGGKPSLAEYADDPIQKGRHISMLIDVLKKNQEFLANYLNFCSYNLVEDMSSWNFNSLAEYRSWLRSNRIMSLDGVPKNSYQECLIANWMIRNGVQFKYEHPYEYPTSTVERRQYQPDFYIPEINAYIEHFGIDENGDTASFIDRDKYHESMKWKRQLHRLKGTRLIETFSWQSSRGELFSSLKEQLERYGCEFVDISEEKILELLNTAGNTTRFATLASSFLTLYKGNGCRLNFSSHQGAIADAKRQELFLKLFFELNESYEESNRSRQLIDFEDMIGLAMKAVANKEVKSPYRYILIDEFQDISPGRAELIRALRDSADDCAVFAVGDDWQSIYRFAGSDIGEMTNFEETFGASRQIPLDKTFRFDESTAEVSSKFVLKNTAQIEKSIQSDRSAVDPSIVLYRRPEGEPPLEWAFQEIERLAPEGCSVLVLERYNFHLPQDEEWTKRQRLHPRLDLKKMSIHAAKGLEADFVILGLRGGYWGFPSQVVDDPLLSLVLHQSDTCPHGEERRLFYVAITRAKRKTLIVCETGQDESSFAAELISDPQFAVDVLGLDTRKLQCSKCGSGTMVLRDGTNGRFFGCSNHPLCMNTAQVCGGCGKGLLVLNVQKRLFVCHVCEITVRPCPRCGTGILQTKHGSFGSFVGCSNYWDPDIACKYKANVSAADG
jgi:DNA helicase-4